MSVSSPTVPSISCLRHQYKILTVSWSSIQFTCEYKRRTNKYGEREEDGEEKEKEEEEKEKKEISLQFRN